jgi:hypothetical protein
MYLVGLRLDGKVQMNGTKKKVVSEKYIIRR